MTAPPIPLPILSPDRLDIMIDRALAHPQMRPHFFSFANKNLRVRAGVSASLLLLLTGLAFSAYAPGSSPSEINDISAEISDYMMYTMIEDAS